MLLEIFFTSYYIMKLIDLLIFISIICFVIFINKIEPFDPLSNLGTDEIIDIYIHLLNVAYDISERAGLFIFLDRTSLSNYYEHQNIFYTWSSLDFGINDMDFYRLKTQLQDELADPLYTYEITDTDEQKAVKLIHKPTGLFTTITMYESTSKGVRRHGYCKYEECTEFITPDVLYPLKEDIVYGRRIYYPKKPELLIKCF